VLQLARANAALNADGLAGTCPEVLKLSWGDEATLAKLHDRRLVAP
jgi:hypothetical protein